SVAVVNGFLRIDHGVRIAFQQFAANNQHRLLLGRLHVGIGTRVRFVRSELACRWPFVNLDDVFQLLGIGRRIRVADALNFPELSEVTTPEIGGKFAPKKLATHFMVEADHVRLDELWIGFQDRNRVGWNQLQIRNQQLLVNVTQIDVGRLFKVRVGHGIDDVFGPVKTAAGNLYEGGQTEWKGDVRIDG